MLKSNVKKVKKHNFKKKLAGKFVFHETKKWAVCNVNREPFDKWECFVLGILSLNMLKSNVKRVKKHNFKKKFAGKFVFHKTKKSGQFAILIVNHLTNENALFLGIYY